MMNRSQIIESLKNTTDLLDARSVRVLSDLARLFICMRWAEFDTAFLGKGHNHNVLFVVDADVAFNWADPKEDRSMMKLFDNESLASTLSDIVGRWLFIPDVKDLPPSRMYQGHASEIDKRVGPARRETFRDILGMVDRVSQRNRRLTSIEKEEIERFIDHASGFAKKAEISELNSGKEKRRAEMASPEMKLSYLLSSPRVKPMSQQWIASLIGTSSLDEQDIELPYEDWAKTLTHDPQRGDAGETDAVALAYVDVLHQKMDLLGAPSRVVFLSGSPRIYRAWGRLKRKQGQEASTSYLRHPLCFLFANYFAQQTVTTNSFDGKEWTAYGAIFESFLQHLLVGLQADPNDLFTAAYHLAWSVPGNEMRHRGHAASAQVVFDASTAMAKKLGDLAEIGVKLATAQALSLRAEHAVETLGSEDSHSLHEAGNPHIEHFKHSADFELLTRLRYLETTYVDELLEQLVSGVLANSLPVLKTSNAQTEPWQKVPILVLGANDGALQRFILELRSQPRSDLLSPQRLGEIRALARKQPSGYLALVFDALVLGAFGEWAAAASMGRRAIERAEYFLSTSDTRKNFEQLSLDSKGKVLRDGLFKDTKDVDGREARYVCAHAVRRSARSLSEFEEADRHLRAFSAMPGSEFRSNSESLALSLAIWSYLRYERRQVGIGELNAIRHRLETFYLELDERRKLAEPAAGEMRSAVVQYVWEQSSMNLAIVLIELAALDRPLNKGLLPPSLFTRSLAQWVFADTAQPSRFARFVTAVACLYFCGNDAESLCGRSTDLLLDQIDSYAANAPKDNVIYEQERARVYRDLVKRRRSFINPA